MYKARDMYIRICIYVRINVCVYVCMHACMYVCMYVCVCTCVCVCVCVCTYVCTSIVPRDKDAAENEGAYCIDIDCSRQTAGSVQPLWKVQYVSEWASLCPEF